MGIHRERLTSNITQARCRYLQGQWRRGHIYNIKQVRPKIRDNLPVREHEVEALVDTFVQYMADEYNKIVCDECGDFTGCWNYAGDRRLCTNCWDDEENNE